MLKDYKNKLLLGLSILTLLVTGFYLLYQIDMDIFFYQAPSRIRRVAAIVIVGVAIAVSTVIFQTIVKNRILTPSIMGLDSVYVFIQTTIVFLAGVSSPLLLNSQLNYFLSLIMLTLFTLFVFKYLFRLTRNNIFILLLIGIILGTFFGNLSTFMQQLISPDDFLVLQNALFASFNAVNENLMVLTAVILIIMLIIVFMDFHSLDVLALGRDAAINLGVNYDRKVSQLLVIIAILVSVSTALVGPIMFLGLLVVNIAHELFKTHKHVYLLVGTSLISIIVLVLGQMIVQFVFQNSVEISVIINLVGGVYFIYLMLRRGRK